MSKVFSRNMNFKGFLLFSSLFGIGRGMFAIFMMWVVHALYQNPVYTGVAGFMFAAPTVAGFIVGPFVDRCEKIALLRIVCIVQLCVVAFILGVSLMAQPGAWLILIAILVFSIMGVVGGAAVTALLPRIVIPDDLVSANVITQIVGTIGGLIIGTSLYAFMTAGVGFELVYGVNGVILLVGLLASYGLRGETEAAENLMDDTDAAGDLRGTTQVDKNSQTSYLAELWEGVSFIKGGVLLPLAVAFATTSLFANIAHVNLPAFAEVHTGTGSGYIILSALALVGGVVGSYIAGIIAPKFALSKIFVMCFVVAGVFRVLFVYVIPGNFVRALLIFVLYAGLIGTVNIFSGTLVQKLPPKYIVGRITTINASLFGVTAAIGALVGGFAGRMFADVDTVFIIQGMAYIAVGVCLYFIKPVRALPMIGEIDLFQNRGKQA